MMTPEELREIAHRATHYVQSHHDLPVATFPPYSCDTLKETLEISYKDIALVFGTLADLLENQG